MKRRDTGLSAQDIKDKVNRYTLETCGVPADSAEGYD